MKRFVAPIQKLLPIGNEVGTNKRGKKRKKTQPSRGASTKGRRAQVGEVGLTRARERKTRRLLRRNRFYAVKRVGLDVGLEKVGG